MSKRSLARLTRATKKVSHRLVILHSDVTDYYRVNPAVRQRILTTLATVIQTLAPTPEASALMSSAQGAIRFLQETEQDGAFPDSLRKPGGFYHPRSVLLFARKDLARALADLQPTPVGGGRARSNSLHSLGRTR